MSRTDKTAPVWVRARYEHTYLTEHHDHRNGRCELPSRPPIESRATWATEAAAAGVCHWAPSHEFWTSTDARCACKVCHRDAYASSPRRIRERRSGAAYTRDGWRTEY